MTTAGQPPCMRARRVLRASAICGRLACQADGKVRMHFSAPRGVIYLVEASTDLLHWEQIGVARDCGVDGFEFEDSQAARLPQRFYRIVTP